MSREPAIATQSGDQQTLQKRRITTNLKIDGLWELSKSATREGVETLHFLHNRHKMAITRQLKVIPIFDQSLSRILQQLNEHLEISRMNLSSTIENLTRHGIDQLLDNERSSDPNRTPARFSKEIKKVLIDSFVSKSPYPSEAEKERLSRLCKLDYKQVSVWFANKRMRTKIHSPSSNSHIYSSGKSLQPKLSSTKNPKAEDYFSPAFKTENALSDVSSQHSSFSGSPFTSSSMDSVRGDSFSPDNTPSPYFRGDAESHPPKSPHISLHKFKVNSECESISTPTKSYERTPWTTSNMSVNSPESWKFRNRLASSSSIKTPLAYLDCLSSTDETDILESMSGDDYANMKCRDGYTSNTNILGVTGVMIEDENTTSPRMSGECRKARSVNRQEQMNSDNVLSDAEDVSKLPVFPETLDDIVYKYGISQGQSEVEIQASKSYLMKSTNSLPGQDSPELDSHYDDLEQCIKGDGKSAADNTILLDILGDGYTPKHSSVTPEISRKFEFDISSDWGSRSPKEIRDYSVYFKTILKPEQLTVDPNILDLKRKSEKPEV
ncbi:hypothetical protein K7432_013347 [Basidiobolus ranarum]|uniref:Homeobox domain-containing protein n=1 Tax=Basidiobolus ranarum TaxID=34480 RepID=A0ABR2WJD7_9FUNG